VFSNAFLLPHGTQPGGTDTTSVAARQARLAAVLKHRAGCALTLNVGVAPYLMNMNWMTRR
jgi:hypothetical protein